MSWVSSGQACRLTGWCLGAQEANDAIGAINMAVMHLEASVTARRAVGNSEALGELFNDIEAQVRLTGPNLAAPSVQSL